MIWKTRMRALFKKRKVLFVIDDPLPVEYDRKWEKAEDTAMDLLLEYLSNDFIHYTKPNKTTREVFLKFDELFERKSQATQLAILSKTLELKMKDNMSLAEHFNVFDNLIEDMAYAGAEIPEVLKAGMLLRSLPAVYKHVSTAIETCCPNEITLSFVKIRLLDFEMTENSEHKDTSAKVLYVENNENNQNSYVPHFHKKKQKFHKTKKNHHFKNNKDNKNRKCFHCGRTNHVIKDCFYHKQSLKKKESSEPRTAQSAQRYDPKNQSETEDPYVYMVQRDDLPQQCTEQRKLWFLLDSGASDHLVNREDVFSTCTPLEPPIKMTVAKNGAFISATKRGDIRIITNMGLEGVLKNVLFCPDVPYNLLSVKRLYELGMTVTFSPSGVQVSKGGEIHMQGKPLNGLLGLEFTCKNVKVNAQINATTSLVDKYQLWHMRLGHMSKQKFTEMKGKQMTNDGDLIKNISPPQGLCDTCVKGKQARLPFKHEKDKTHVRRPLFIVHTDVCGPITPSTHDDKNYYIVFVDEYTHYCAVYLMRRKSDAFSAFRDFANKSEAHFNLKLVNLYCDNGREYLSTEMKEFCVEKGISYHFTVPYTPQQNGVAERMIRYVTEKATTMLSAARLDQTFWGEATYTAAYLINLSPTTALKVPKTPYEMWHGKKPNLRFLRVFGSTAYVHKVKETKFDEKSWKGIFIGYQPNGYKIWDVNREMSVIARDVIFDETNFLVSRPTFENTGASDCWSKPDEKSKKK